MPKRLKVPQPLMTQFVTSYMNPQAGHKELNSCIAKDIWIYAICWYMFAMKIYKI